MKRFTLIMTAVCACLLLLCAAAIVMGRTLPASDIVPGLSACDSELPCYQGIMLNSTTLQDATSALERLPDSSPSIGASVVLTSGPVQKVLMSAWSEMEAPAASTIVREIDLFMTGKSTSIAGIVAGLGIPCGVYPMQPRPRDPLMLQIVYPQMDFWVQTSDWSLEPNMLATQIDIGPTIQRDYSGVRMVVNRCETDPTTFYNWKGFSRYPLK